MKQLSSLGSCVSSCSWLKLTSFRNVHCITNTVIQTSFILHLKTLCFIDNLASGLVRSLTIGGSGGINTSAQLIEETGKDATSDSRILAEEFCEILCCRTNAVCLVQRAGTSSLHQV